MDSVAVPQAACRVYAPVGGHRDLLAYLVRRLLENGANSSFVSVAADSSVPVSEILRRPQAWIKDASHARHPRIPLPRDLYGEERRNSLGPDPSSRTELAALKTALEAAARRAWTAAPIVGGTDLESTTRTVRDPCHRARTIGTVADATVEHVDRALARAAAAAPDWDATPAGARGAILERVGDLFEARLSELVALIVREGGRTIPDAVSEVREAVDFCRYYSVRARADFAPMLLPGPTGERNALELHGRGVFACISPWNFPLAIFTGQIAAALAAGNAVIAKPAEQTPLVGAAAVRLMHQAGVPVEVLHLLPGDGAAVGARLVADIRISGVAFTGSTETARAINLALAQRGGPLVPLIAETGGQNALIVDSSALPEQVVQDVLMSAFNSAGQRCSALRVLCLQADIAERVIAMLKGAMAELAIGDPGLISTDVGSVIDEDARATLQRHADRMAREGSLLYQCALPPEAENGFFFAPRAFEIDRVGRLEREVFGPILHVVRWQRSRFDELLDAITATGYGLTLGIHSRIDETVEAVHRRLKVGNTYVNRNMIGAVVGVQPFGGEGLSGTGPKAGGPHYLYRFALERTLSVDTTAAGGNASLLSLQEEAPS